MFLAIYKSHHFLLTKLSITVYFNNNVYFLQLQGSVLLEISVPVFLAMGNSVRPRVQLLARQYLCILLSNALHTTPTAQNWLQEIQDYQSTSTAPALQLVRQPGSQDYKPSILWSAVPRDHFALSVEAVLRNTRGTIPGSNSTLNVDISSAKTRNFGLKTRMTTIFPWKYLNPCKYTIQLLVELVRYYYNANGNLLIYPFYSTLITLTIGF